MDESLNKIRDGKDGYKDLQKLTKMWEAIIAFHQKG
jgi:CRISPR/Cas system CSM-associated protein Csm2 small subunit